MANLASIMRMELDEKGVRSVLIKTTLVELERIVSELKKGSEEWGTKSAIMCPTGSDDTKSSITFWIDNPN
jgi:hypothetical protein